MPQRSGTPMTLTHSLKNLANMKQYRDFLAFGAVVMVVVMMVIPLPPLLLDVLLAANISVSLLILLLTMNIGHALEFSIFPSLLLVTTLFRLGLNVSSTRLILLNGYAGEIIQSFGMFVVGGNLIVGFVVFLILVAIQYIVITKGAERVAEVAARFTLDAMPGKQMSIDADLNAGLLDQQEARRRRQEIEREADFYGAMDGASKFVKGDAIAGILIAFINIFAGFAVGMMQRGMSAAEAAQVYTLLTVGDGLVTQIPALLISTAMGIIVTRSASEGNMGQDMSAQLLSQPKALGVAAVLLVAFAFTPGMPTLPFLALAGGTGFLARALSRRIRAASEQAAAEKHKEELEESKKPDNVVGLLQVDTVELEIGYSLIPLVDSGQGGDLLERITLLRRQLALELGLVVPAIRIRDNMQLQPHVYVMKLRGVEVGRGEILPGHFLAMDPGAGAKPLEGIRTREPAFGLPALWITPSRREEAELAGYTVVDPASVVATHLTEMLRRHAPQLLGRQDVKKLIDNLKQEHGALIDELIPDLLGIGDIQKVLQALLREGVPIRNLVTILEALADGARLTKDPETLTELAREALAPQISHLLAGEQRFIPVITLDPDLEDEIQQSARRTDRGTAVVLDPIRADLIVRQVAHSAEKAAASGYQPVILCAPSVRVALRRLLERSLPRVPVISYNEVGEGTEVQAVGTVTLANAS